MHHWLPVPFSKPSMIPQASALLAGYHGASTVCIRPWIGTSVATQRYSWVNGAFSEPGYLAQIKYRVILLSKIQLITLRWNCIMTCKSISMARSRQRLSPLYFILLDRHAINLRSWVLFFPRQLLVLLDACFCLNSCFLTDIMSIFRILWMSALCGGMYCFGRNSFLNVSWNYTLFFHSHLTAVLTNLLRPVSLWPWSSTQNSNYCC